MVNLYFLILISNLFFNFVYTTTNKTAIIPIFNLPSCKSDQDCSYKGSCNIITGICTCESAYDTYISNKIINAALNRSKISIINAKIGNSTIFYQAVNLTYGDFKYCNYQKKKQLTALLLSIFVGFGAEHFYLERYKSAAAKIVFSVFCFALNIIYFIIYKCFKDGKKYVEFIGAFEAFYLSCGFLYMILWTVYDCVNIGFNKYHDGNGIPMQTWYNNTSG
jgi:hypothetical protein